MDVSCVNGELACRDAELLDQHNEFHVKVGHIFESLKLTFATIIPCIS